jgi:acyl-CoA synthetase (AMP-forming)/AMP-acid ligase II
MGLIGGLLTPFFADVHAVLFSPLDFLRVPARWLRAISRYRASYSGGPNSSFDLCVRKIAEKDLEGVDLSSWTIAWNGAEPVRTETMDAFSKAFARQGFRRDAFLPCYGLAEATLMVTACEKLAPTRAIPVSSAGLLEHRVRAPADDADRRLVVSVGRTVPRTEVTIVDAATGLRSGEGSVGEIWACGPGLARGYYEDLEHTEETFGGQLEGDDRRWLRTGDLGFVDAGDLFVTGRLKDLIIIRGKNYYPEDIERAVQQAHGAIRRGCVAAFSIEHEGEERIVVVAEAERRWRASSPPAPAERRVDTIVDEGAAAPKGFVSESLIETVRQACFQAVAQNPHEVVLIVPGTIPKTSSGKLMRHACREHYLTGRLQDFARG